MKKTDVLNYFGGPSKTAVALGIHRSSVATWGDIIPIGRAYQIQVITGGALRAEPEQIDTHSTSTLGE